MPIGHGCHPDKHVMGPLSCAGHILRNRVNSILSIVESTGARGVGCSGPCSRSARWQLCVAVWRSLRPMPLLPSLSHERAAWLHAPELCDLEQFSGNSVPDPSLAPAMG